MKSNEGLTIVLKNGTHAPLIEVIRGGKSIFTTLNDCFGMDRVRVWLRSRGYTQSEVDIASASPAWIHRGDK